MKQLELDLGIEPEATNIHDELYDDLDLAIKLLINLRDELAKQKGE